MNVLGIDIGYSNLKLAYGAADGEVETALRPAGAAPADRFGSRFDGRAQDDFLHVLVDGEPFIFHQRVKTTGFQPVSFSCENEEAGGVRWTTDTAVTRYFRSSITLCG